MSDTFSALATAAALPDHAAFLRLLAEFSGEIDDAETAREGLTAIEAQLEAAETQKG